MERLQGIRLDGQVALTTRTNRPDNFSRCEDLLGTMDEVHSLLVTIDFSNALTRGLTRNPDLLRSVPERTRSDLTLALRQRPLENVSPTSKADPTTEAPSAGPFAS